MNREAGADRTPRTNLMLSAELFREGKDSSTTHRVVNLSATGARIAQPGGLRRGDRVAIAIGQAETVDAEVLRTDERSAALRFEGHVDLDAARRRRSADFVPVIAAGWMAERQRVFR